MSVVSWLLEKHPFFCELRQCILGVIEFQGPLSLDDLVVRSRRPVRTVLLMLNEFMRSGEIRLVDQGIELRRDASTAPYGKSISLSNRSRFALGELATRYLSSAGSREAPALLWSQRRLIPSSSIDRCGYILQWLVRPTGSIIFFGDDDLVSPLLAAAAPGWKVHVVDIDRAVLDKAEQIAKDLGGRLTTHHSDLSALDATWADSYDVVVSDPFPSGDGSFETMFWGQAARVLQLGGVSVTTIAPSHKPLEYSSCSISRQTELGFYLMDIQADFGLYESFEFEFTAFECGILERARQSSTVSQTKSIMAARKLHKQSLRIAEAQKDFDFTRWMESTLGHYLTIQAGVEDQQRIAATRGLPKMLNMTASDKRGLKVKLILPAELRSEFENESRGAAEQPVRKWSLLLATMGVTPNVGELDELVRLESSAALRSDGSLAELGLAIRAMESWGRWRLDE
jgi:predicted methyltransferase